MDSVKASVLFQRAGVYYHRDLPKACSNCGGVTMRWSRSPAIAKERASFNREPTDAAGCGFARGAREAWRILTAFYYLYEVADVMPARSLNFTENRITSFEHCFASARLPILTALASIFLGFNDFLTQYSRLTRAESGRLRLAGWSHENFSHSILFLLFSRI